MRNWTVRHPLLTTLVMIVLVAGPGYWMIEQQTHRTAEQATQACEDRRNGRLILRELVELSDDGRGGFNLTSIDSFKDLDPATQKYLSDLEAASKQSPHPSEFVQSALALLDVPDCT